MKKLARILSAFLCMMLVFQFTAIGDSVSDILPETLQWGLSRTRFREANGSGYADIELEGYKSLMKAGLEIDGYKMDAYYQFATDKGSYYGLTKAIYLLDVTKKMSNKNLETCYNTLVDDLSKEQKPTASSSSSTIWEKPTCTVEITTGTFTEFNNSKNKTVAIIITEPTEEALALAPVQMRFSISSSCSNYNHVGYSWEEEFEINGKPVSKWGNITVAAGDKITLEASFTENDKSPDYGHARQVYTVKQEDMAKGFKVSFSVDVREDKGRYSGCVATWNVTFTFSK